MFWMTQLPVSKYLTGFAPPLGVPLQLFKDPEGLSTQINPTLPPPKARHPNSRGREGGSGRARTQAQQNLQPRPRSQTSSGTLKGVLVGVLRARGMSEPAQGSGRAGPPHLHSCGPAVLMAAPAPIQTPGPPCLPGSASGLRPPDANTRRGRGLEGAGMWAGQARLHPSRPCRPQSRLRAVPLPFSAAVVE